MKKLTKSQVLKAVRMSALLRDKLLADKARPRYHFAAPGCNGYPGDPNMAFYADGRYHLMFLYNNPNDYFRLGHLSSRDLLHWTMHPDAVFPDELDGGIFSGGAFVDGDGTAYMAYWALPREPGLTGGIRLARSTDVRNHYEKWEKFPEFAVRATSEVGITEVRDAAGKVTDYLGCTDPSNIWKVGGSYYMQLGALVVLNKFRQDDAAPDRLKGDWTELYRSEDLKNWTHLGRFYRRDPSDRWTDRSEDDMCPSFLPLPDSAEGGPCSGKYLQLFIAHNKGAQYYIGSYDPALGECPFTPERHGRMSWADNSFFAPEALIDGRGRQLMWAWLRDDRLEGEPNLVRFGYSGVYSLPRALWINEEGELGMAPAAELRSLRYGETGDLSQLDARSCEVMLSAEVADAEPIGLRVHLSARDYVDVYYDAKNAQLVYDASHALQGYDAKPVERAPLTLRPGEKLRLNLFVDGCVIEVFANDRQAICRRSYTDRTPSYSVRLLGKKPRGAELTAWNLEATNLF